MSATDSNRGGVDAMATWRRIYAMILRHLYILRGSWPRLLDLAYWPTVQMIMWGFMSQFLSGQMSYIAQAFGVLLSAVLLWDVLFRGQLAVSISFFEEMWSRNLGHLFVTPLRPGEFAASLLSISLLRTLLGIVPASLLAVLFFGFSVYTLGLSLAAFFFSLLMFGWAIGLGVTGLVLRHGLGAENIAWGLVFALLPISAVYYPVSVLPTWLQYVAYAMPPAYSFEGMRSILLHGVVRYDLMAAGFALNIVWLALGVAMFFHYFRMARRRGSLLQQGE
ncbi:MAG: transporter permease [Alphaproteobacteria bacterium]|nr:transporter permease [Alphaproteobacteria bacterium]